MAPEAAASSGASLGQERPPNGGVGCCYFRAIGAALMEMCEPLPLEQEAGHVRLARMREEQERLAAEAKAKAEELRKQQEIAQKEWEAELEQLKEKRANMTCEELERDALNHFACSQLVILRENSVKSLSCMNGTEATVQDGDGEELDDSSDTQDVDILPEPPEPSTPFERWLAERMGRPPAPGAEVEAGAETGSPGSAGGAGGGWRSFGELQVADAALAETLDEALVRSAEEDEREANKAAGLVQRVRSVNFDECFEEILARYALEDDEEAAPAHDPAVAEHCTVTKTAALEEAERLRARATRYRAVAARVSALAPTLEGDSASARLVAALGVVDLVDDPQALPAATLAAGPGAGPVPDATPSQDLRGFRAPMAALSTADVCWALCSEKRRLVAERMLPSTGAGARWWWPEVRRFGIGWWLAGPSSPPGRTGVGTAQLEQLDVLVTRMAQSAVAHLRHFEKTGTYFGERSTSERHFVDITDARSSKVLQRLADKAVFWYVTLGTKLAKLKALVKTGVLKAEPALSSLLNHERSEDPVFIRKNAFRLLQLHRFHLAAALFMLCGSWEEAAGVAAKHLQDMQLVLVVARRRPDVSEPLLRQMLAGLPQRGSATVPEWDPWARLLLAWHLGDAAEAAATLSESAAAAAEAAAGSQAPSLLDDAAGLLFDGALRCTGAGAHERLANVAAALFGPGVGLMHRDEGGPEP